MRPGASSWPCSRSAQSRSTAESRPTRVRRSAALLGGFLTVAAETGLALRTLEIGASAGLNLRWDHFRYEAPDWGFGDRDSPVHIAAEYEGRGRPPQPPAVLVIERAGCDHKPIDPTSDYGALTLQAFVWPDQLDRLRLLRSAIEVPRQVPAVVEDGDAADWLEERLARPRAGAATVVYLSIVWGYLADEQQARITALLEEAGASATDAEPLAWLRMEPGSDQTEVRLTSWPGRKERLLAEAGYHGRPVRWLYERG